MENQQQEDALQEKIRAYKASVKEQKPDLDVALLLRMLDILKDDCEIHVAIDPVSDDGWQPDAPIYGVTRLDVDEEGRFVLLVNGDKHGITNEKLYTQVEQALRAHPNDHAYLYFNYSGKTVRLTEAYSHAQLKERWGGMPFDLVLAIHEKQAL